METAATLEPAALTIAETSERSGVSAHALRYYERIGLLDPVARAASGQRLYGEHDLRRIRFLACMRATGMPIEALKHYVELVRDGEDTSPERRAALEAHRASVVANIAVLRDAVAILDRKIDDYRIWENDQ